MPKLGINGVTGFWTSSLWYYCSVSFCFQPWLRSLWMENRLVRGCSQRSVTLSNMYPLKFREYSNLEGNNCLASCVHAHRDRSIQNSRRIGCSDHERRQVVYGDSGISS